MTEAARYSLRDSDPQEPEEDFANLLDKSFTSTNLRELLENKGDVGNIGDEPERLTTKELHDLYRRGLAQRSHGQLEESHGTFATILGARRVSPKFKRLVIGSLAEVSIQLFDTQISPAAQFSWLERAYDWFRQLGEITIDVEPHSEFNTAIQLGKLQYRHQLLVDDPAQKRQLLTAAYSSIESARGLATPSNPSWQFIFHASHHLIARRFCMVSETEDERELWLRRWYDEALTTARLSENLQDSSILPYYLASLGYASSHLAERESDPAWKLDYLRQSYASIMQVLELNNYSSEFSYTRTKLSMAIRIASQIADLVDDPKERVQWLERLYLTNKKAAELEMAQGDLEPARRHLHFSTRYAEELTDVDFSNQRSWREIKLDSEMTSADYLRNRGDCIHASYGYANALRTIEILLRQDSSQEEQILLLRKKLKVQILIGQMSTEAAAQITDDDQRVKLLRHASIMFANAADSARKLSVSSDEVEKEHLCILYHDNMIASAQLATQIGNHNHAAHCYSLTGDASEAMARGQTNLEEQSIWLERCYEERILSAQLAVRSDDRRHAAFSYALAGKVAQQVPTYSFEDRQRWGRKAYEANLKAAELWKQINQPDRANNSLRIASAIASRFGLK